MPVPEAAVHEDNGFIFRQNDVGSAGQGVFGPLGDGVGGFKAVVSRVIRRRGAALNLHARFIYLQNGQIKVVNA